MPAFDDPRELASFLVARARGGDWASVRAFLGAEFHGFSDSAIRHAVGDRLIVPGVPQPGEWDVEEHEGFTTVRLGNIPSAALVFRRDAGDTWRLDPGSYALSVAKLWEENPNLSGISGPSSPAFERRVTPQDQFFQILELFDDSPMGVIVDGNMVTVTFEWLFRRGSRGEVPLSGLRWTAGAASGSADVAWTTAVLGEDRIVFPAPPNPQGNVAISYVVTFEMDDVPIGDELHLQVDGLTLSIPGRDALVFSIDYRLPTKEYPQPEG